MPELDAAWHRLAEESVAGLGTIGVGRLMEVLRELAADG